MPGYRVVVIGGGPAGYAAALQAAELGADVTLVEAEQVGGACVNYACIPTNILLQAALVHADALELGLAGAFTAGETFNLAGVVRRKDALVRSMREGIATAIRMRKVRLIEGRAAFRSARVVTVTTAHGTEELSAEAFVVATGTRWDAPTIPGIAPDRVLTADGVQRLPAAPRSAVVIGGSSGFALEYAVLLTLAGAEVTLALPGAVLAAGLDSDIESTAVSMLGDIGIRVVKRVEVAGGDATTAVLSGSENAQTVPAEIVVAADVRRPYYETLNLALAGVAASGAVLVDSHCRTSAAHIFAAGDVTGGLMLSSAASHMGEVAGANAAGDTRRVRLGRVPHLLHTLPEIAWVGLTEEQARTAGHLVTTGLFDLSFNARSVVAGGRQGLVKLVADAELGEILGVHAIGPDAGEIATTAAALMQAEATVQQLAEMVFWHPSASEGLREAARRAVPR